MFCDFVVETIGTDEWRHTCRACGAVHVKPAPAYVRPCPSLPTSRPGLPQPPSLVRRVANFTVAAIGHALEGFPTCTDEQIQLRLAICRGCEHFVRDEKNPDIGACNQCGCPANDRLPKFVSKLAWADQSCPLGRW